MESAGYDPKKKTLYFNFDENMQELFGLMTTAGENPIKRPEVGSDETANDLNEKSNSEPGEPEGGEDGKGGTYQNGIEYGIASDNEGITTWFVVKQLDGRIDTIKYGGNKNGKPIDTVKGKKR